jgi:hypothetical protein
MSARGEALSIRNDLWWMDKEYSGCDWCCGGGDEERAYLQARAKVLEGEVGTLPPICTGCGYGDVEHGWLLCPKCTTYTKRWTL